MRLVKPIRRSDRQSGFMLLELLISMVVLSVGLGGLLALMLSAMATDNRSGGDTTATMVAEHVLEQVSAQPANGSSTIPLTDCAGNAWSISTQGAAIGTLGNATNGGLGANRIPACRTTTRCSTWAVAPDSGKLLMKCVGTLCGMDMPAPTRRAVSIAN